MSNDKRTIDTFLKLVKINSTSRNEAEIREYLVDLFKKLNTKPRVDKKGNIHVRILGMLATGPTIMFNAHMDTVVPGNDIKPIIKNNRIMSDGNTVLGADDKAGITGIIELARLLKEKKVLFKEIKIILTVEEEISLQGAKALTYDDVEADYCFVLDSDNDVGSVVVRSPAQDSVTFKVKGVAAHAGLNPEDGISAIKIAAEAIANIKVGRIDRETTSNIGTIKGGSATNIVPDEVIVRAEARSHDEDKLQQQVGHMVQEFKKAAEKRGGDIDVEVKRSYNRVAVSKEAQIVKIAEAAAHKLSLRHTVYSSGGGSDASIIYSYGIPTIALCIGMEQVHSKKEYITIKNLTMLPKFLVEIVKTAHKYGR